MEKSEVKTAGSLLSERIRVQLPKFEASTSPHVLTLAFSRHLSGRSRTLQGALSTTAIVLSCWHILVETIGVVQFEAWSASNLVAGLHIIIGACGPCLRLVERRAVYDVGQCEWFFVSL